MSRTYDEETAVELLRQLVEIDSVNPVYGGPGEEAIADFIEKWLSSRGLKCSRQSVLPGRSNIYSWIGPTQGEAVLLEAHMDTVGVEGWQVGSPHELTPVGDRLYGRGSCDTKSSLASFLLTFEYFSKYPELLSRPLVFAASVDEESKQLGAVELAKLKTDLGIAWAITGEPTRSDVISRHKGFGRYLISTSGKAVHASTPDLGVNAIYKAASICRRLETHALELQKAELPAEIDRGSLNVGMISGGVGFNIVPDTCRLDVDRRLGRLESAEAARGAIERICSSVEGTELEIFLERPPLRGEFSSQFVAKLLSAGKSLGLPLCEREVPYMTNAVAYEAAGIPAVVFGPGDIAQAHKVDEYIERGEIVRSTDVLVAFLSA